MKSPKTFGMILLACALLSQSAFAQEADPEVFARRAKSDNSSAYANHNSSYESDRFIIWYSSEASISQSEAANALNALEKTFDALIYENGYKHPYEGRAANQRFKAEMYLMPGGGSAYGSTRGNPSVPIMWIPANSRNDTWTTAHEFTHGLQIIHDAMSGGSDNAGTNFRGWFFECHANLMPHLVYPDKVHFCSEMYTRMSNLYLGSTRNRYCNWQFFEYIIHRYGVDKINKIWDPAGRSPSVPNHDPFTELMHRVPLTQTEFGDVFGDFATKMVTYDINRHTRYGETTIRNSVHPNPSFASRGSSLFRDAYNGSGVNTHNNRARYTYLEALDDTDGANGRFVVPNAAAPQRYAYNIIRLYPDDADGTVTVKFRGDVQTENNITNYAKNLNLEPAAANLPNDPGSDWRYGLVAVTGDATSRTGTVTARYSELRRAVNNGQLTQPDVSITLTNGETQLYLVVAATPTVHHKISWDQFYYTIYRFPYMVEIGGAKPEGFQAKSASGGSAHGNGGGWVSNGATVAATAYVGPNARVTGGTVSGNARIEGRATVAGGTVSGEAVVKDHAYVAGGTVSGNAVIEEGANIWRGTINTNARVGGIANVSTSGTIGGSAEIRGAPWMLNNPALNMSGTGKLYGDGEVYGVTITSGAYTGLVDAGVIGQSQHGANRTSFPTEVTKPRSMAWYGDQGTGVSGRQETGGQGTGKVKTKVSVRGRVLSVSSPNNNNDVLTIRMIDVRGRTVARFVGAGLAPASPLSFSLTNIPAGKYFVDVKGAGVRQTLPVVVK